MKNKTSTIYTDTIILFSRTCKKTHSFDNNNVCILIFIIFPMYMYTIVVLYNHYRLTCV